MKLSVHTAGYICVPAFLLLIIFVGSQASGITAGGPKSDVRLFGAVTDSTSGRPIEGATVYVVQLRRGKNTDKDGKFLIEDVPPGAYDVMCRHIGYTDVVFHAAMTQSLEHNFLLAQADVVVQGVTVQGRNEKAEMLDKNQSVAVLSTSELDKDRGQTLGATLEKIPGVTTLQTGPSISKPIIRGLHSDRVLILNAGVPQEGQQWGGEHAPEIDPFAPARIEVLKGAAGVEYGAGAIGGVISLSPRAMRTTPGVAGQLTLNGFSNNRQGSGSLSLEGNHSMFPGLSWRAQGSYRRAGNEKSAGYIVGNTGFSELDGSFAFGYVLDHSGFEAQFSHFETELGIYKGSHIGSLTDLQRALASGEPLTAYDFTYDIKPPKQNISHDLWSVKANHQLPSLGKFELQFGWQNNHRQEFDAYRFFNNVQTLPTRAAFDLVLTTYSLDLKLKHNPFGAWYGTVGLSGMRQGNVILGSSFLIPGFRTYSGGVYSLEYWSQDALTLSFGVRYDYRWMKVFPYATKGISETLLTWSNISGAVGASYHFSPEWSLGGNLGTAFRPPSINELFSDGVHHGSAQYERGDQTLKNERSFSVDMTLKHLGERYSGELSLYNNYMENFIFLFPTATTTLTLRGAFPTFLYEQANSLLRGIDGAFDYNFSQLYTFGANASLVRGQNLVTGEPLYQMPADRMKLSNTFSFPSAGRFLNPSAGFTVNLVRRQDHFPPGVDFVDPPPGYVLVGLTSSAEIVLGSLDVHANLDVNNLFNTTYRDYLSRFRYYINDPGRDIVLRVRIPFGDLESE